MRGGKDEKQMMSPMFPRLHVNDAEKGGPRAPPRNKMALYEQLTVPSQRSTHGSASVLPILPTNGSSFAPLTSSGNGDGRQSNAITPFYDPLASSPLAQNTQGFPLGGVRLSSLTETYEQNQSSYGISVFSLPTKNNSFQQQNSHAIKPFRRKPGGVGDLTVPVLSQSRLPSQYESQPHKASGPSPHLYLGSSPRKQAVAAGSVDLQSRIHVRVQIDGKGDETTKGLEQSHASIDRLKRQHRDLSTVQDAYAVGDDRIAPQHAKGDGTSSSDGLEHGCRRRNSFSSASCLSPDDVVGVLGEKKFWKARRAIVNQQRVFSVQVFELHRIIKVQNLIARSPHVLFEESLCFRKPAEEVSPPKKVPSEPKDNSSQRLEWHSETVNENAEPTPPMSLGNIETTKGHAPHMQNHSGNPVEPASNKSDLWCFPPPGNQWLVPIVSPSEGLVYKPYAGPGPPNVGFTGPVYGSCGPIKVSLGTPSPIGPSFFPPYGMPMVNSSTPNSTVDQYHPYGHSWLYGRESQLSEQGSQVVSQSLRKVRGLKGREMEGSTGSSPCERLRGGDRAVPLPLFPTSPTYNPNDSHGSEQRTRVIKVVPHNPKLATESAARIFQSIQEERKQCD